MQNDTQWTTERRLRRSHGRWQPHGPRNSLRKRVTVAATWIHRRVPAHRNYELFPEGELAAAS